MAALLPLFLLLVGAPASALTPDLQLELSPLQPDYLLFEPVLVRMTMRNGTGGTVEAFRNISLDTESSHFWVSHEDGEERRIVLSFVEEPPGTTVQLAPGASFSHDQLLYSDVRGDYIFDQPGTWTIRGAVDYHGVAPSPTAEPVEIVVRAPGGADATAAELFGTFPVRNLVMRFGETPEAMADLGEILASHADSRFADYAHYVLAQRLGVSHFERPPDPERVVRHLEALLSGPLRAPQLESSALEQLFRELRDLGREDRAREVAARLRRDHPGSPSAERVARLLERDHQEQKSTEPEATRAALASQELATTPDSVAEAKLTSLREQQEQRSGAGPSRGLLVAAGALAVGLVLVLWRVRGRQT